MVKRCRSVIIGFRLVGGDVSSEISPTLFFFTSKFRLFYFFFSVFSVIVPGECVEELAKEGKLYKFNLTY